MSQRNFGFTVIELLVVLGMLGILVGIGFTRINPPSSRLFANDLKAMLHQARYEAIKRNQPVAFVWDELASTFRIRIDSSSVLVNQQCTGDQDLTSKSTSEYRQVEVEVDLTLNGVVWLPTGQARGCDGAPMTNSNIEVSANGVAHNVEVSMGGKVIIN